jgi:hypothetical protein
VPAKAQNYLCGYLLIALRIAKWYKREPSGCTTSFGLLCNIQGFFIFTMVQIQLSRYHQTSVELCYKRQGGKVFLYDDTTAPRQQIATISGCDLDGWVWETNTPKLSIFWRSEERFGRWRAALMDAVLAYINHSQ